MFSTSFHSNLLVYSALLIYRTLVPETRKANDKDKIKSKTKPKKTTELEGVKRVQKMKKVYMKHLGYENSQEKSPSKKQTQSVQAHNSPFSPFAQSPPSSDILNFTSRNITNSPPSPIHMWDLDHSQSDHLPHLPRQRRIVTPGSLTKTYTASDVALSPLGRDQCKRQSETKSIQKSTLLNDRMHTLIYQDEQTPNQYQSAAFRYKIPSYNTENSISSTLPPPSDSFQQCSNTKPHVSQFSFAPAFDSTPLPLPSPLSLSTQQSQTPHKSTEPRSHKTNNEFRYDQQKSVSQTRLNISHRARSPLQTLNEQAFAHSLKSPNHNKGQRSTNFRQASPKSIHKPHSPNFLMDSIESEDFDREVQKLLDWTKGLDLDKSL